jgi:hypothetical protein
VDFRRLGGRVWGAIIVPEPKAANAFLGVAAGSRGERKMRPAKSLKRSLSVTRAAEDSLGIGRRCL